MLGGALTDALGSVHEATLFASVADVTAVAGASGADLNESIAGGSKGGAAGGPAEGGAALESDDRCLVPVCFRILLLILSLAQNTIES